MNTLAGALCAFAPACQKPCMQYSLEALMDMDQVRFALDRFGANY